jgi:PAS domain S-box-containing protein
MGARIRAFDWSATPMGSPDTWPQALRSALSICLHSSFPTAIYWGPELRLLYNDAWSPIPAEKHPWALGRPAHQVWAEIWNVIEPQLTQVLERAQGFSTFDEMLPMLRGGRTEETYWNYSFTPILDDTGRVAGIFNQGHETTEQVCARRGREAQIHRYREMFEQAPGPVALLRGPEHVFEVANAAYLQLIDRTDVLGKPVATALPEIVSQGFLKLLDEVYASGEPYLGSNVSVKLKRGPGGEFEARLLDFIFQPILSAGEISGIFVQATDVTERALAEASLRESEERFRLVAESAPVMLWMSDSSGQCVYTNRAQRDFWGVTLESLSDFDWSSTLHPEDRAQLFEIYERAMHERTGFNTQARFRRSDGEYRMIGTRASARFASNGAFVGMIGVNVDMTEVRRAEMELHTLNATLEQRVTDEVIKRSQAEETLRQVQKMEAIGQLTGGIAHDFNNMLAVVIGGLNLLKRRLRRGETNVDSYVEAALEGAQRAASLTQRLLAFARQQPLEPVPIDLNRMVGDMTQLLERTLGETIRIQTRFAPDLWTVRADRGELESAVLNLAVNARDAMKSGGLLSIGTSNTVLDEHEARDLGLPSGEYVLITFADVGTGMTPDVLARAFDPFFTTKSVGEGTGLGLSQVFGFVKQSRGHVKIDSDSGRGTTVRIYLPRFPGEVIPAPSHTAQEARSGAANECILVVEDEPRVRAFSVEALSDLGYDVVSAANGAEAMQIIERGQPVTLLFTDIVMPDMSGWKLAEFAARTLPDLKIVFTSGYAPEATRQEVSSFANSTILTKPFSIEQLAARIREALDETEVNRSRLRAQTRGGDSIREM